MSRTRPVFAACAQGLEEVLAQELTRLGASNARPERAGVECLADRPTLWRMTLASRIASRIVMPIAEFAADHREALYDGAARVPWHRIFEVDQTFAIHATGRARGLRHSGFIGQVVKDAICDRFRAERGRRPSVDRDRPDMLIDVHVDQRGARISLDAAGYPLHRRGYREGTGPAPIKETLAAGILALSGWTPEQPLFDPMCGSGTFVIEAALMAAQIAPGLLRRGRFAFESWSDHDRPAFLRIMDELRDAWRPIDTPIFGFDTSARVLDAARGNAKRARVGGAIEFRKARFERVPPPIDGGVIVTNPPYGQRLDADPQLYRDLGDALKAGFGGWTAWIIAATAPLKRLGLKPARRIPLRNGPIDCRLVCIPITARRPAPDAPGKTPGEPETDAADAAPADAAVDAPVAPVDTAAEPPAADPTAAPATEEATAPTTDPATDPATPDKPADAPRDT